CFCPTPGPICREELASPTRVSSGLDAPRFSACVRLSPNVFRKFPRRKVDATPEAGVLQSQKGLRPAAVGTTSTSSPLFSPGGWKIWDDVEVRSEERRVGKECRSEWS